MSMTLTTLRTRVKTRIRADLATPTVADLHDTSITTWANEKKAEVIHLLKDAIHFPSLMVRGTALTFSSGQASFPSDYEIAQSVRVGSSDRRCRLFWDPDPFNRFDSSNFVVTPSSDRPLALIADKIYIKPTSFTSGKLDYAKKHPDIASDQDTLFDELGDNVLVELIVSEYFASVVHDAALAQSAREIAYSLARNK